MNGHDENLRAFGAPDQGRCAGVWGHGGFASLGLMTVAAVIAATTISWACSKDARDGHEARLMDAELALSPGATSNET
jgi:hypothetical protein